MMSIIGRCRDLTRRSRTRSVRPSLEGLEDRKLLYSTTGGHWVYPNLITYSFMPDGTSIGGTPSSLYQTFDAITTEATWKAVFEKAAAIWQQVANINLALVPDDGTALGSTGDQQGDPRFGDIRIGATPQSAGQLAYDILPPPINGGSDAGDMLFNSTTLWKINNDFDLLTVAIHEFGHALGLGHSAISTADMYASYTSMKQTLTSDDIAGIQSIYGAVPADATNNTTSGTAIDLSSMIDGNAQVAYNAGYVTAATDYEWYKVTVPSTTTGTMVVQMQTTDLSSLSPRLAVYNGNVASLGQSVAAFSYGATVTFTVNNVTPGQVYYIRASAGNSGPGSNGAFGLLINFGSQPQAPVAPPNTVVASQPNLGGGTSDESVSRPQHHAKGHHHKGHRHHGLALSDDQDVVKLGDRSVLADALTVRQAHPRPAQAHPHHRHHH